MNLKWLCKIFPHSYDLIGKFMIDIKDVALNREDFKNEKLVCRRCGKVIKVIK